MHKRNVPQTWVAFHVMCCDVRLTVLTLRGTNIVQSVGIKVAHHLQQPFSLGAAIMIAAPKESKVFI